MNTPAAEGAQNQPRPASSGGAGKSRGARRLAMGAVIVLALVGGAQWYEQSGPDPVVREVRAAAPDTVELLPEDVGLVSTRILLRTIPLTGTIAPLNQTEIKSQQAAEIREVLVREGEPVTRGQIIARLDASELESKLRDKLGALAVGEAQHTLAQKNVANNASLLQRKFISQSAFDDVRSSLDVSEATLVSLRAQVEQARKALRDAVVRSPIDGVVAERIAEPGLAVADNAALFTVQDLSLMNVEALVPANDIPRVRIGQQATVSIEGFGERVFIGKVDRINPSAAKGTRSIVVHVLIANPNGELRGGMFAHGSLAVSDAVTALVVPRTAVREHDGRHSVFVLDGSTLVEQAVVLGVADAASGVVEVKSGLAADAQVVLGPPSNLQSGMSVRLATTLQ